MARRVRRLFYCWVAILIAILVLSSNHASATSIVFTSTADFDAGTKSDPGDGNYGAETVTDNPAIPADQFQSGNIAGDSFSHSDADGNTFKWTKIQTEGSGSDSYSITSGSLDLKWTSALNAEQTDEFSTAKITGDFDIRTLVTSVSSNNNFDGFQWYLLRNQGAFSGGSQDGVGIRWDHGTNARFRSAKIVSGSLTVLNTHADCGATCYLRMTRSTNDFTFYYSADGSSWTTITTATTLSNVPASVYIDLSAERLSLLAEEWTVDSIWLQSGTVASGGFRTSGNWASASQSATAEYFDGITISYSGASSSNYISAISLFDSTSFYFFISNLHLTSGSSHSYAIPNVLNTHTWKVRVNLTSDGSGTPSVLDVTITTHPKAIPSVTTQAATEVLCTSVVLNGNVTSFTSPTVTVGFHFGTSATLTGASNLTAGTKNATGAFFLSVSGLIEGTKYYFDAWANGTDGYGHGSILNFTTPACPTICGTDPYAPANLWSVGILAAVAVVLAGMASALHFRALWILSGIAILFISFYSVCMGGFVPAGLVVVIGIFAMLEGIPAREGK